MEFVSEDQLMSVTCQRSELAAEMCVVTQRITDAAPYLLAGDVTYCSVQGLSILWGSTLGLILLDFALYGHTPRLNK